MATNLHASSAETFMKLLAKIGSAALMGSLLCGCSTSAAQPAASRLDTNERAQFAVEPSARTRGDADLRSLMDTINALKRIHTDSYETDIPAAARPLLTTLKHQLRDLIGEVLASEGSAASAQQVEARAIVDLRSAGIVLNEQECGLVDENYVDRGYDYGQIHSITVSRPRPCFDLIAVTTTIGVCCGEDTSLYLFKHEGSEWNLVLVDEVNDYHLVSEARGTFEFGVSWPDDNSRFFVVATSVNPWCSSGWQNITYRVLRPGPTPSEPRVLLSQKQTIWLVDDPPYRLDVREGGFTLSFHDERYLDQQNKGEEVSIDDPRGMRIIKYSVEGDSVRRKG